MNWPPPEMTNTINCTLLIVQCTVYIVHCTLYSVHCTLCTVHCALYTVHCTLYTVLDLSRRIIKSRTVFKDSYGPLTATWSPSSQVCHTKHIQNFQCCVSHFVYNSIYSVKTTFFHARVLILIIYCRDVVTLRGTLREG